MKTKWPAFRFGCLLLAGAAITAMPASAQLAQDAIKSTAGPSSPSISDVRVARTGQQTTVNITGTGDLHYQASRLDNPARLVLDFANTRLSVSKFSVPSEYSPVRDVRMGQSKTDQSRIVIDLSKPFPFTLQSNGAEVIVSFTSPYESVLPATLPHSSKPARQKSVSARVPEMPLPAWLTGTELGFARPAALPAVPEPQNPSATSQQTATAL